VGRRWPAWLAVACAAVSLSDVGDGLEYMILFVLPATGYLFLAVVDLPRITWAVVVGALATVVVLRALDIDPWPALAVVVVALAAVGLIDGRLRRPGGGTGGPRRGGRLSGGGRAAGARDVGRRPLAGEQDRQPLVRRVVRSARPGDRRGTAGRAAGALTAGVRPGQRGRRSIAKA
jgi:hypothetical protein